jgi:hypothetical protein
VARIPEAAYHLIDDIRNGRHKEAYALFIIGLVIAGLGLFNIAETNVLLAAILLALSYLIFHTAEMQSQKKPALDQILQDRQDFGTFSKLLPGVRDLRIFGPTAVNLLVAVADIKRFVLNTGGVLRVLIEDSTAETFAHAAIQLDDNLDFQQTLSNSIAALEKLRPFAGFSYGLLPINPGFSLVIVNANDVDGYVIFESHGFKDENIADRMHIVIRRSESPRWFAYWVTRYEAMWSSARKPLSGEELRTELRDD